MFKGFKYPVSPKMQTENNTVSTTRGPGHFVECAFFRETGRPFLLPMLEGGMFIRDFATYVRDALCIPPTLNVVLCEAWTGKPCRGLHWLLPNTALQIRVSAVPATDKPPRFAAPALSSAEVLTARPAAAQEREGSVHVHAYLDAIVTADGHGIGGIGIVNTSYSAKNKTPFFKSIVHDKILDIRSAKACEQHFLQFALTYVRQQFGEHAVPHVYCATKLRAFFVHTIDLATPELTLLRKASVRHYRPTAAVGCS